MKNRYQSRDGNTLVEYGLLFSLLVVLGATALVSLGNSTSNVIGLAAPELGKPAAAALGTGSSGGFDTPIASQASAGGNGYYYMEADAATGLPSLHLTEGNTGVVMNTSSVDGMVNTLGATRLAVTLDDMAAKEQDPDVSDYYHQLARTTYYLGASEGGLDDMPTFDLPGYSDMRALQDVVNYQGQLGQLMKNPPTGIQASSGYGTALAVAADAYNISKQYSNKFNAYIDANGKVDETFDLAGKADSAAGSALQKTPTPRSQVDVAYNTSSKPIEQAIAYDDLRKLTCKALTDNGVSTEPAVVTLKDAKKLNAIANAPAAAPAPIAKNANGKAQAAGKKK